MAWETRTPEGFWQALDKLNLDPMERLVLIALKHFADKEGKKIKPAVARICTMTGMADRSVRRILKRLKRKKIIKGKSYPNRPTEYHITHKYLIHNLNKSYPDTGSTCPDTGSDDHTQVSLPPGVRSYSLRKEREKEWKDKNGVVWTLGSLVSAAKSIFEAENEGRAYDEKRRILLKDAMKVNPEWRKKILKALNGEVAKCQ